MAKSTAYVPKPLTARQKAKLQTAREARKEEVHYQPMGMKVTHETESGEKFESYQVGGLTKRQKAHQAALKEKHEQATFLNLVSYIQAVFKQQLDAKVVAVLVRPNDKALGSGVHVIWQRAGQYGTHWYKTKEYASLDWYQVGSLLHGNEALPSYERALTRLARRFNLTPAELAQFQRVDRK
jgi:hypothetical protein